MENTQSMMEVMLNDDELVDALARRMCMRRLKQMRPGFRAINAYQEKCQEKWTKARQLTLDFNQARQLIWDDLVEWRDEINLAYKLMYRPLVNWLQSNLDRLGLDREVLLAMTQRNQHLTFTQQVANTLGSTLQLVIKNTVDVDSKPVIRNTVGNEKILRQLITQQKPFWFIDSGYTNFLEGKKTYHRLVVDHIHHSIGERVFPADRLHLIKSFPRSWRPEGRDILVIESSDHHHKIFDSNSKTWKRTVETQLRAHTNRNIVFKPKNANRKARVSVYDLLQEDPGRWYCVVSDSSAAAIEAIWLGIPVITLGQHITNPVSRSRIADIDNLYRGPIGDWLCALSYSQFTKREMINGQARKILQEYHGV